jgi:cyanophycinase
VLADPIFRARCLCRLAPALVALAAAPSGAASKSGYSTFEAGTVAAHSASSTSPGLLLVGGGDWDEAAMRWFAEKAGHGHVVLISASGGDESGKEMYRIGRLASVQTIEFHDRSAAYDPHVIALLRNADGIFIAGGDQANYVRYWKGTPVARLIDRHVRSGKPLGGTSAGLAILGSSGYGAMDGGSIDSPAALLNPAGPAVTMVDNFLHLRLLRHVVTDTHFGARQRLGRLIAFVARVRAGGDPQAVGLGIDEGSALAVEASGRGHLFTRTHGYAWVVDPQGRTSIAVGKPLDYAKVKISGVGSDGVIMLPGLRVSHPAFVAVAAVKAGKLSGAPSPEHEPYQLRRARDFGFGAAASSAPGALTSPMARKLRTASPDMARPNSQP